MFCLVITLVNTRDRFSGGELGVWIPLLGSCFLGETVLRVLPCFWSEPPSLALGVEATPFARMWGSPHTSSLSSLSYLSIYTLGHSMQTWLASKTVSLEDRDCTHSFYPQVLAQRLAQSGMPEELQNCQGRWFLALILRRQRQKSQELSFLHIGGKLTEAA